MKNMALTGLLATGLTLFPGNSTIQREYQHWVDKDTEDISRYLDNVHCFKTEGVYELFFTNQHTGDINTEKIFIPLTLGTAFAIDDKDEETLYITNNHLVDDDELEEIKRRASEALRGRYPYTSNRFLHTNFFLIDDYSDIDPSDDIKLDLLDRDEDNDIAYLKGEETKNYNRIRIGDSSGLELGDVVYAIGYPLSAGEIVTRGIVAGQFGPEIFKDDFLIDAPTSPGSSGSPVFAIHDNELELVGIHHSAIMRGNDLGFVIPINNIKKYLEEYGYE